MPFSKLSTLLAIFLFSFLHHSAQQRQHILLDSEWKFFQGSQEEAASPSLDASDWEEISLPHDWAITGEFDKDRDGSTAKLPWKGEGWYRRSLDIPDSYKDKRLYLLFDGVMAFPEVYINGKKVGEWDYGYNSFYVDITEHVELGKDNLLAVHADTRKHDSRWYPGAGIYRKVQLLVLPRVHVPVWGSYITTPIVKPHYADVRAQLRVQNHGKADSIEVRHSVFDPEGKKVKTGRIKTFIPSGKEGLTEATLTLMNPKRWDIHTPDLYKLVSEVWVNGKLTDRYESSFGIRTIRFDADHGFFLNERRVQLKGVNLHHDHGPLGAAFYPRAMERQLEIMKGMGVNAIRNSHNVAAPELLEMCDRMGLLFFNEIFDKYDAKAGIRAETDFDEFAHRNIRNFVIRDRNHPSVFLWSVGNEIGDVQWNLNNGFHRLHTMLNYVRKYDPYRPTTLVNDQMKSAQLRHFDLYDVHAYNYGRRYRLARQMEPNKAVIISESASTLSTRGFYEFPLPQDKTAFTPSLQMSSYDLHAPTWAEIADDDFMWQQEEAYIAGEFVWTGFDYLGEPTPYYLDFVRELGLKNAEASRSSYFGIVDLVGIPKDRYYLYKSYWKPEDTTLHILPHWNWPDRIGKKVPVFVYTNGDCAELFVNGKSQGMKCKQPKSDSSTLRFRLMWPDVIYEEGQLEVVAYQGGEVLARKSLETAGKAHQLRLTPDRKIIHADGRDLSYILVEMLDAEGNLVPTANHEVNLSLGGEASIAGVGNGNPQSFAPFQAEKVKLFYGKAMVILKAGRKESPIELKGKVRGMKPVSVRVNSVE